MGLSKPSDNGLSLHMIRTTKSALDTSIKSTQENMS